MKAARLYNKCQSQQSLLPLFHRAKIVREHFAFMQAIGNRKLKTKELALYHQYMSEFIDALPPSPTEDEIINAIEFYRLVDRKGDLPEEFEVTDRMKIFERHELIKEIKDLSMATITRDYSLLLWYKNYMYKNFTTSQLHEYSK